MRLRFPVLALALLAALCGGAAAQDVLAGDGWVVINGFNGNAGDWIPRTTPSPLQSGLAKAPDQGEGQAVFLKGNAALGPMKCWGCSPLASFVRFGGLERRVSLEA